MNKQIIPSSFFAKKLISAALFTLLAACSQEEIFTTPDNTDRQIICFNAQVDGATQTRAFGNSWSVNDSVGIYMKEAGSTLSESALIDGANNILYTTPAGNGSFKPLHEGIQTPESGTSVDFIAYYPHKEAIKSFVLPINILNQKDPEAIDLLYSNNLNGISDIKTALNLNFNHQLSRLSFTIKSANGTSLSDLKIALSGLKTTGSFDLKTGSLTVDESSAALLQLYPSVENGSALVQAIVLPEENIENAQLIVTLNNKQSKYILPIKSLVKGKQYNYNVTLNSSDENEGVKPEAEYTKWRETPVITKEMLDNADLMYVKHLMPNSMVDPVSKGKMRNYSMLYSKKHRIAYWVAYPLFAKCIGSSGRTDAWAYDPEIPTGSQANLKSGFGGNGYDRGHQIPSGDRTCDKATNETTFYYSNMTPQLGQKLNQSIWANLENKVRSWVSGTDTVFVVTGAIPPKSNVQYMKEMAVPEYYFKALARKVNGSFTTIAFKFDNEAYTGTDYMKEAISVKELEDLTGFTFFPSIDASAKATLNTSNWQ